MVMSWGWVDNTLPAVGVELVCTGVNWCWALQGMSWYGGLVTDIQLNNLNLWHLIIVGFTLTVVNDTFADLSVNSQTIELLCHFASTIFQRYGEHPDKKC